MLLTDGLAEALENDPRDIMWALAADHFGKQISCALPELSYAERHRARLDREYEARAPRYFD